MRFFHNFNQTIPSISKLVKCLCPNTVLLFQIGVLKCKLTLLFACTSSMMAKRNIYLRLFDGMWKLQWIWGCLFLIFPLAHGSLVKHSEKNKLKPDISIKSFTYDYYRHDKIPPSLYWLQTNFFNHISFFTANLFEKLNTLSSYKIIMTSSSAAEVLATNERISTYSEDLSLEIIFGKQEVQIIKFLRTQGIFPHKFQNILHHLLEFHP